MIHWGEVTKYENYVVKYVWKYGIVMDPVVIALLLKEIIPALNNQP